MAFEVIPMTATPSTLIAHVLALAVLAPLDTRASETALTLARDGGAFTVEAEVDIDAPSGVVQRVLSDPGFLPVLNPRVRRVEQLATEGGAVRIRVASRRCLIGFCRDFSWVQDIRREPGGDVTVRFEPGSASVDGGEVRYDIDKLSLLRTRVRVRARIIPAVSLPPLIGPMIMRHTGVKSLLNINE